LKLPCIVTNQQTEGGRGAGGLRRRGALTKLVENAC